MISTQVQEAVSAVGYNAKYQKLTLLFFGIIWFEITYFLLGCPFIFMNPVFRCDSQPDLVSQEKACPKIQECRIDNDYTLTAYAQLYCDEQGKRDIIQSALFIGSVFGLFLMNMVSDTKGRKFGFIASMILGEVGTGLTIIGGYSKSVSLMAISQIFCGFGGYAALIIGYIYISDICQGKLKSMGIIAMNGFWGVAEITFCLYYYVLPQWYNFLILIVFIPTLGMIVIGCYFLVETPTFLIIKKQDIKSCMNSLEKIAMFNEKGPYQLSTARLHAEQAISLINAQNQQKTSNKAQSPIRSLFCNPIYLKTILCIAIIQISTNMYYYGIQYSLQNLGFNFGIDILLAGAFQTLAYFSINFFIHRLQRKKGLLITNLASFVLGFLFIFPFISKNKIISSIILCLCRMANTYSQGFIPLMQTESFPQQIASSGAGMIEGISQLGSFSTPYIVNGLQNLGQSPVAFLAIFVLIVGIVPLKFVRQTFVKPAPKNQLLSQQDSKKQELLNNQGIN